MKTTFFLSALLLSIPSLALPKFVKSFAAAYPEAKPISCVFCHTPGTNKLNLYGLATQKSAQLGSIDFKSIEGLDSDEDTFTNLEEILAGSFPGDKDSTPQRP